MTDTTQTAAAAQNSDDNDHKHYRSQDSDNYTQNRFKEMLNIFQSSIIESVIKLHAVLEFFIGLEKKWIRVIIDVHPSVPDNIQHRSDIFDT